MGIELIINNLNKSIEQLRKPIIDTSAIEWERTVKKNFEAGGRPSWKPRKKISKKQRGRKILVISGALKNYHANGDVPNSQIKLIADPRARAYSQIQNEGGTINRQPRSISFRKNKSGRTVFASSHHKNITKTVTSKAFVIVIPKREHTNIPESDYSRWMNSIQKAAKL